MIRNKIRAEIASFFSIRTSLRAQVALGVTLPLIILALAFSYNQFVRQRENNLATLSAFTEDMSAIIESNLRQRMLAMEQGELQDFMVALGGLREVETIYLLDVEGQVIFASQETAVGQKYDPKQPECQACHAFPLAERPRELVVPLSSEHTVFRSMQVIENTPECATCHERAGPTLGLLVTELSFSPYAAELNRNLAENYLWWGAALLTTLFLVRLVVSHFVLDRLETLSSAITSFGEGKTHVLIRENRSDEIGQINDAFNRMAKTVEARRHQVHQLTKDLRDQIAQRGELLRRLITAQEDERKRVARDLHDELGQTFGGLSLRIKVVEKMLDGNKNEILEQISLMDSLVGLASDKMYDMISDLRPSVLDDLGLLPAIRLYAERVLKDHGIRFSIDAEQMSQRLPHEVETAVYRTFQEALQNVVRHSNASRVDILLRCRDDQFEAQILDDGQGFDPKEIEIGGTHPRGLGLLGMRERIAICGGKLNVLAHPGEGTRIQILIDLGEVHCG